MNKYRIKLIDGRVIGPFNLDQIEEAFSKGLIRGSEECQVFPDGSWELISENKSLNDLIIRLLTDKNIEIKEQTDEVHEEFQFSRDTPIENLDYEKLESDYNQKKNENNLEPTKVEATRVFRRGDLGVVDKTVVIKMPDLSSDIKEEEPEDIIEPIDEEIVEEKQLVSSTEKTEFFNIELLKGGEEETDYPEKNKTGTIEKNLTQIKTAISQIELKPENVKKMKPIVAFAFIIILYLLIFDEDENTKPKVVRPKFSSPIVKEIINTDKAHAYMQRGVVLYKAGSYLSKIKAANQFKNSLEENFDGNPSLSYLIKTYAELIENAQDKNKASVVLHRLIRITRSKTLKNADVAYGTALFYNKRGKSDAALRTLENFLRVEKPSLKILCLYGNLLIDKGNLVKADNVITQVNKIKNKSPESYLLLARFNKLNQKISKARDYLVEGAKKFPNNIEIQLSFAEIELNAQNYLNFEKVLIAISLSNAGGEPTKYAHYLELTGILSAYKNDAKNAALLFKSAIGITDTPRLRSRLSSLEARGGDMAKAIILESQSLDYLSRSKSFALKRNWEEAFKFALEAVDTNPNYLPVELNLVDLQIKRGYLESAINKLDTLKKIYPSSKEIIFRLVKAYLASRKFNKAKLEINYIATSKLKNVEDYYRLLGYYYMKIGREILAIKFFNKSIKKNPLSDNDYFLMAKIFMRNRKYTEAKKALSEAVSLDPENLEHRVLYSKILFELEGSDTAIGYLQDLLEENKDNALLMGKIAIYYYKTGQVKQFEYYKNKFNNLKNKDSSFYLFLIESAELEDRPNEVIANCKEVLKINPGNIEIRIKLANYLSDAKRYSEALEIYSSVQKRLQGYPLASYYIGKIHLLRNNLDKAFDAGNEEIKYNPRLYHGHYLVGEALRRKKEYGLSVKALEKAISLAPRSVETLTALAWIKMNQNYLEMARELYIRARNVEKYNPEIRRELGMVYVKIGQSVLAREEFETYLKLSPQAPDRAQIKAKIKSLSR